VAAPAVERHPQEASGTDARGLNSGVALTLFFAV
jgi:hypothetical protein